MLAVAKTHRVWLGEQQRPAQAAFAHLPAEAWQQLSAGAGSQGPRWSAWAWSPLSGASPAGWGRWLLARRSLSEPTELAYDRVCAPAETPLEEAVRAAGSRWSMEEGFERAEGEMGLDQYEVRRWDAWHRHITLALLAHASLEVTRLTATTRDKRGAPLRS